VLVTLALAPGYLLFAPSALGKCSIHSHLSLATFFSRLRRSTSARYTRTCPWLPSFRAFGGSASARYTRTYPWLPSFLAFGARQVLDTLALVPGHLLFLPSALGKCSLHSHLSLATFFSRLRRSAKRKNLLGRRAQADKKFHG